VAAGDHLGICDCGTAIGLTRDCGNCAPVAPVTLRVVNVNCGARADGAELGEARSRLGVAILAALWRVDEDESYALAVNVQRVAVDDARDAALPAHVGLGAANARGRLCLVHRRKRDGCDQHAKRDRRRDDVRGPQGTLSP